MNKVFSRSFTIYTSLTPKQVANLLESSISGEQSYFAWYKDGLFRPTTFRGKYYQGTVTPYGFRITKIFIGRGGSFLPIVAGRILEDSRGSIIEVSMSIHPWIVPFTAFEVMSGIGVSILWSIAAISLGQPSPVMFGPLLISLFGYWMLKSGESSFNADADEATHWLKNLFAPYTVEHD